MRLIQSEPQPSEWRSIGIVAILGIVWWFAYQNVEPASHWVAFSLLGLSHSTALGESIAFFLYDVPKILLLLSGMIFVITVVQTFISTEKVRQLVEQRGEGVGNVMASLFGALTPFCSCSSVPLFIGFVQAGIPLGITFSFLITSPIMNEVAFVMLWGMFGWQVAVMYLVSGVVVGVVAGIILGRMKLERYVEGFVYDIQAKPRHGDLLLEERLTWTDRFERGYEATRDILKKVWLFIIIGIAIGAFIHGFVPEDALTGVMGTSAWWSVPVSVLIGIPLYSNASGIIPIISAMLGKGAALGTVLAFMMSVVALSLPELIILRRVLKPRLLAIFVIVVALAIIFTGYLFNWMLL